MTRHVTFEEPVITNARVVIEVDSDSLRNGYGELHEKLRTKYSQIDHFITYVKASLKSYLDNKSWEKYRCLVHSVEIYDGAVSEYKALRERMKHNPEFLRLFKATGTNYDSPDKYLDTYLPVRGGSV
jgi:hypothetical protein